MSRWSPPGGNGGSLTAPAPSGDATGATDTTALQSAINTAAAAGQRLDLLQGTYIYTSLTLPSGSHIRGMGRELTILKQAAASDFIGISNANPGTGGNNDITIESLQLDGNKANRTSAKAMCIVTGTQGGVQSGNCNRIVFRDIYAHDASNLGLVFQNVRVGSITGCHVANNSRDGITVYFDSQDIVIANNQVHDCGDDLIGLNAEDGSSTGHLMAFITVTGNTLGGGGTSQGSGIACRGGSAITITANTIYQGFSSGIVISNANTTVGQDITVADNEIIDAGANNTGGAGHGIELDGATTIINAGGKAGLVRVKIENNQIRNARANGILVQTLDVLGPITDLHIRNNQILCGSLYNQGRGISVSGQGVSDLVVAGNLVVSAQKYGIIVGDNTFAVTRPEIADNRVFDCGQNGGASAIYLNQPVNPKIVGNRCANRTATTPNFQTFGITIVTPTGIVTSYGNDFTGCNAERSLTTPEGATWQTDLSYIGSSAAFTPNVRLGDFDLVHQVTRNWWLNARQATLRESCSRFECGSPALAPATGIMYLTAIVLYAGDIITNLSFASAGTGLTRGSTAGTAHLWVALYDTTKTLIAQSSDQGDTSAWAGNSELKLALGSPAPYTVPATGVYWAAVMIVAGAGGSPVMPTIKGPGASGSLAAGITGQAVLGGHNGSALTATAPTGPLTIVADIIPYAVAT